MKKLHAIQQWVERKNYKCYYTISRDTFYRPELNNWCRQHIKGEWVIASLGSLPTYIILFKNDQDRTWFILNWSGRR